MCEHDFEKSFLVCQIYRISQPRMTWEFNVYLQYLKHCLFGCYKKALFCFLTKCIGWASQEPRYMTLFFLKNSRSHLVLLNVNWIHSKTFLILIIYIQVACFSLQWWFLVLFSINLNSTFYFVQPIAILTEKNNVEMNVWELYQRWKCHML